MWPKRVNPGPGTRLCVIRFDIQTGALRSECARLAFIRPCCAPRQVIDRFEVHASLCLRNNESPFRKAEWPYLDQVPTRLRLRREAKEMLEWSIRTANRAHSDSNSLSGAAVASTGPNKTELEMKSVNYSRTRARLVPTVVRKDTLARFLFELS